MIKLSSYLEKYFDKQPEHTVNARFWPECNVFTNCHGPQCCSRVSTGVFGKSNRNLEYVIIFYNISVTSKNVINLIIFPYKHPKIDFLAAYNSRTGNGLVKNSVLNELPNLSFSKWRPFVECAKCFEHFVKIFNELYLFSMDFALCLTLDILASLVNAFFLVHDSENPKFGSLNSCGCARS